MEDIYITDDTYKILIYAIIISVFVICISMVSPWARLKTLEIKIKEDE